ncbi:MAG: DNA-binding response regulator [Flammeovirgaceae bacterium]|nr:DNA-binding response regulator [Flammeovirgaceae bacterium]MBE62451.1 DNA-binding response regulator [Flammeovirgaceae bacterium]MBR09574.1 DNA-binding response regulator [Rickettsiales bacterium]
MNLLSFLRKNSVNNQMRIFLTDDHAVLIGGLQKIIEAEHDLEIVGTAGDVQSTMDSLTHTKVDLLITDYNLPDEDGLTLVRKVKRKYPHIKILVLSMHDEAHLVKEILKEGVDGYLIKKDSHNELINAIYSIKSGKTYLSSDVNSILIKGLNGEGEQKLLTDREREILKLISKEFTNKQIAEELFISERTVETHRKNIFRKTGTNNLVGLIKYAYANNLI